MYPNMVTTLYPVDLTSALFQPYFSSTIGTLLNNSFIQTSTLNGIETFHLNSSESFSTDFESNLSEVFLQEPRFLSDVSKKVYYGRIKTMSDIPEEQDHKSTSEQENFDGSSGSFSLYEFLKKFQPRPVENNIVDTIGEERLTKQLLSRRSKSEWNKTRIPSFSNSKNSVNFTGLGTNAFPLTSIPMNAFQSGKTFGIGNDTSDTNKEAGNSKSQVRSDDINYTTFNNFLGKKKGALSDKTAKIMETLHDQRTDTRWRRITNLLMDIVHNPKKEGPEKPEQAEIFNQSNSYNGNGAEKYNLFDSILANWTSDLGSAMERRRGTASRTILLLTSYSLLLLVSLFANLLVCHVVLRTRRLHTVTNTFLANLAVSDLVMTTMNIPFSVARVLLDDWPFGATMCCLVPFVQVVSVYVSSFTMAAIALDRYQVIIRPLRPRMGATHGALIIAIIWVMAALLALPYAIYNQVVEVFTYRRLVRCQPRYPPPALVFRRWLTLATFLTQYALPLSLTLLAYAAVVRRVWWGAAVGVSTRQQATLRVRAKKKTVKMLMVVVILFALCWLPLNTYHLVVDFSSPVGSARHSSSVFFLCHWFAMSSVCYNPFIYCWLNDHFRAGAKSLFTCARRRIAKMLGCATRRRSCQGCMDDDATDADLQNLEGFVGNTSRDGLAQLGTEIAHQRNSGETATSSSTSSSAIVCVPFSSSWKDGGRSSILKKDKRDGTKTRNVSFRKPLNFGPHKKMDYFTSAKSHEVNIPMHKLLTRSKMRRINADSSGKSISIFKQRGFRVETNPVKPYSTLSTCSSSFIKKNVLYPSRSGLAGRGLTRNLDNFRSSGNVNRTHSDMCNPMRDGRASYLDAYSGCPFTSPPDDKGLHVHFRSHLLPDNTQSSTNINDALGFDGSHCDNQSRNRLRPCSMDDVSRRSYNNSVSHDLICCKKRIRYGSIVNDHHTRETAFPSENHEEYFQTPSKRREQEFIFERKNIQYQKNAFPENYITNPRFCRLKLLYPPYIPTWDSNQVRNISSNCISSPVGYETETHYFTLRSRDIKTGRRHSLPPESARSADNIEHQISWPTVIGSNTLCVFSNPNSDLASSTKSFRCYSVDYLNDF